MELNHVGRGVSLNLETLHHADVTVHSINRQLTDSGNELKVRADMASGLTSPLDCCTTCTDPVETNVPGPPGADGADGSNGANGVNAYTTLAAQFTVPAELATATATVGSSTWMAVGQVVYLQGAGWFGVTALPNTTQATLQNLEDAATGAYAANVAPGTVIAIGMRLVPSGPQGATGITPVGAFMVANNLSEGVAATKRTNLGLGTAAVKNTGVANATVPLVDDAGGLTNGEAVFATAAGVESKTAANARTALGLGTMATQAASAVAITGGAMNGTLGSTTPSTAAVTTLSATGTTALSGEVTLSSKVFTTPSALQTVAAANLITCTAPKIRVKGNGGAVVMTSTPTISLGTADGQLLLVQGTDDANTVQVQDNASLAGSKLKLAAANRTLGKGDMLLLSWDATDGLWYEIAFNNVT